ncbi:MAG: thioredoxin domain-containing protein, partial [Candidatus Limnocylindrales bacterium]
WTPAEVADALRPDDPKLALAAWDVTEGGNWHEGHGRTILRRVRTDGDLAATFGWTAEEVADRLERVRAILLTARDRRPQPNRDDKVLAGWNGLAIAALAEAAVAIEVIGDPAELARAAGYRAAAIAAANVCVDHLLGADGRLGRSWKDGRSSGAGVLEDYACLAEGLLALYDATFDERWFRVGRGLADTILARFSDPAGGFFDTADDHEILITRPRELQDNAVPSGGAMAATVLLRLAALTGEGRYRDAAEGAIQAVIEVAPAHPTFFGQWLAAIEFALAEVDEIAIAGDPAAETTGRLLAIVDAGFQPFQVRAVSADPTASSIELLAGRFAIDGRPTAFVCHGFACRLPVVEPAALADLLAR